MMVAVRLYTGRAIDVIAFSLGVPVARKAIMGGEAIFGFLRYYDFANSHLKPIAALE